MSTNKKENFLLQLLNKRNRIEIMSLVEHEFDIFNC